MAINKPDERSGSDVKANPPGANSTEQTGLNCPTAGVPQGIGGGTQPTAVPQPPAGSGFAAGGVGQSSSEAMPSTARPGTGLSSESPASGQGYPVGGSSASDLFDDESFSQSARATQETMREARGEAGEGIGTGVLEGAKDTVRSAAEELKQRTRQTVDQARQKTSEFTQRAKRAGSELGQQARDEANSVVETQKGRAADTLGEFADALRQTSDCLLSKHQDRVGFYTRQASDRVGEVAAMLRERDPGALMRDAEQWARRHPQLVIGGALVAGFALARFLKSSSAPEPPEREYPEAYGDMGYGEPGYSSTAAEDSALRDPYRDPYRDLREGDAI